MNLLRYTLETNKYKLRKCSKYIKIYLLLFSASFFINVIQIIIYKINSEFAMPNVTSVFNGSESVSYLGPKIWAGKYNIRRNVDSDLPVVTMRRVATTFFELRVVKNLIIARHFIIIFCLTLSWRRPLSYRNQSIDFRSKSIDWFLYDNGLRHKRVKKFYLIASRI